MICCIKSIARAGPYEPRLLMQAGNEVAINSSVEVQDLR